MIFPRCLDRPFQGLGAEIGEEDAIGEAVGDKPVGEALGLRDLEQVRRMPKLLRLRGQRGDEMGMVVAEGRDGDPATEIEIAFAPSSTSAKRHRPARRRDRSAHRSVAARRSLCAP